MEYWHNLVTEKSWKILQQLKGKFDFSLIGGWAAYLWTRAQKSRDIDIIVDFRTLEQLKKSYDVRKNDHLKKYEIKIEEIDVDIYVPYYSRLAFPLEDLPKEEIAKIEGFSVVSKEILLILKQSAEEARSMSEKGEKDRLDILSLLFLCDVNYKKYLDLLKKYSKEEYRKRLQSLVKGFQDGSYFNLTPRQLKLKKQEILKKIQ